MVRVGLGRITPVNARTGGSIGGGSPSFLLPFADAGAGVVNILAAAGGVSGTFTRATTATTVLSSGLIGGVASGAPRSYYDPTSLTYLGYLAEGSRINLLLQSADTSNASWTKTDATPSLTGVGPDGGANTANLITEGVAGTALVTQGYAGTADTTQSMSIWLKRGNTDWVRVVNRNSANNNNRVDAWINLATGAVGTVTNQGTATAGAATIKAYPNGWYRVRVSGIPDTGVTTYGLLLCSAASDGSTVRVNNATFNVWGAQAEQAAFESTYIPTTVGTVTRNADVLTYPLTGWHNAVQGTLFAQFQYTPTGSSIMVSLTDGTANEQIRAIASGATISAQIIDGGVAVMNQSLTAGGLVNTTYKEAIAYALNDSTGALNGAVQATDTSVTLPTVTSLTVGTDGATLQPFGPISSIRYFPLRLSNSVLQQITT